MTDYRNITNQPTKGREEGGKKQVGKESGMKGCKERARKGGRKKGGKEVSEGEKRGRE